MIVTEELQFLTFQKHFIIDGNYKVKFLINF